MNSACIELLEIQLKKRQQEVRNSALAAFILSFRKDKESIKAYEKESRHLDRVSYLCLAAIERLYDIKYLKSRNNNETI